MRVRIIEPTANLNPQRKRVCAYARVSSASVAQGESLENQTSYYQSLIESHPDYEYVGVFADQGTTGTKDARPEFQKMLVLAMSLAASVSVFAFQAGETPAQIQAEVAADVANGQTTDSIAAAAEAAGVNASVVQAALVANGKDPVAVAKSMVAAGFDPTSVTSPAAAGPSPVAQSQSAPSTPSLSSSSFSSSPSASIGGGGRSSVSGS